MSWELMTPRWSNTNTFEARVKPFIQKLRQINPILLPMDEKEVKKILDAKIIVPLRYSDWVANLVPVRNKSGEIRPCVDFRNLNKSSLKDNYPLPKVDNVLEKVVGANRMSMIDGFFGYNQIAVSEHDKEKQPSPPLGAHLCMTKCLLV